MAKRPRILIVEDEEPIRELIAMALTRGSFEFVEARDAVQARRQIAVRSPDLVLLDWMLPGESGIELARALKREAATRALPIIMLTARGEEASKVRGLDAGVDDYVTKPFSPRELLARIRAVLRRSAPAPQVLEVAGLRLDPESHRASVADRPLELRPIEYRLLHFLMVNAERAHSRGALLDRVWGDQVYVEERTVDVHVRRLRKSLEPSGHDRLIQTVRGVGYRFSAKG